MKKIVGFMAMTVLLCAGAAWADVAPGMQQGAGLFEQMDQDGDGIVSQSEFEEYSMEEGDKTQLFSSIDQDGDGTISRSEWQGYEAGAAGQQEMGVQEEPMATEQPMEQQDMSDVGEAPTEQPEEGMDETLVPRGDYENGSPENVQREHLEQKLHPSGDVPADLQKESEY